MEQHDFLKQKVASMCRFSKDILTNTKVGFMEDHFTDKLVCKLEADLYQMSIAEKEITYHFEPSSFLDWLLRRRKTKTIKINIDDALKNPPMTDGCQRLYTVKKLD